MSFQQRPKWSGFFIRRFFRIYPPYLLAVLLFALLLPEAIKRTYSGGNVGWLQLVSHLLLVHNFNPVTNFGINPSFWSIAVEVQLYLLYPVLLLLVKRFNWQKTLFMLLACQVLIEGVAGAISTMLINPSLKPVAFEIGHYNNWLEMSPLAYWFSWSLGAWIADAYLKGRTFSLAKDSLIIWFALTFLSYFVRPLASFVFLLFSVVTAIAISKILSEVRPQVHIPRFCLAHLRKTGIWSYSIYLLHQPLLGMMNACLIMLFPAMSPHSFLRFWLCIVSWVAIMPIGGVLYRLCERPSIALGKRMIR
jgi:peptidoglycan/LPS O-acetylase OafA/YrhL